MHREGNEESEKTGIMKELKKERTDRRKSKNVKGKKGNESREGKCHENRIVMKWVKEHNERRDVACHGIASCVKA